MHNRQAKTSKCHNFNIGSMLCQNSIKSQITKKKLSHVNNLTVRLYTRFDSKTQFKCYHLFMLVRATKKFSWQESELIWQAAILFLTLRTLRTDRNNHKIQFKLNLFTELFINLSVRLSWYNTS